MADFAEQASVLAGVELDGDYPQVESALEAAMEALTLAQSLLDTFMENGAVLPAEPTVGDIEHLFDAHQCELRAATVLLCDYDDSVDRCGVISSEIETEIEAGRTQTDPRTALGFVKLAERITLMRADMVSLDLMIKEKIDEIADSVSD